jgi:hypothetical protein
MGPASQTTTRDAQRNAAYRQHRCIPIEHPMPHSTSSPAAVRHMPQPYTSLIPHTVRVLVLGHGPRAADSPLAESTPSRQCTRLPRRKRADLHRRSAPGTQRASASGQGTPKRLCARQACGTSVETQTSNCNRQNATVCAHEDGGGFRATRLSWLSPAILAAKVAYHYRRTGKTAARQPASGAAKATCQHGLADWRKGTLAKARVIKSW